MSTKGNYIRLNRAIIADELYDCHPIARELFIYFLLKVNWIDDDKRGVKRGEWKGTINEIRDDLSWLSGYRRESYSKGQIRRAYGVLTGRGMVRSTGDTLGLHVSVVKYDRYQARKNTGDTTGDTPAFHPRSTPTPPNILYNNNNGNILEQEGYKNIYNEDSVSFSVQILKIVEPVFGNLYDPLHNLGGVTKWGPIVMQAVNDFSLDGVKAACHTLVELVNSGKVQYNNPKTFFTDGISGYIIRSQNKERVDKRESVAKQWEGFCITCGSSEVFENREQYQIGQLCKSCELDTLVSEWEYKHNKAPERTEPIKEPDVMVTESDDPEISEHMRVVQAFLRPK
jgi:hypothetical protein